MGDTLKFLFMRYLFFLLKFNATIKGQKNTNLLNLSLYQQAERWINLLKLQNLIHFKSLIINKLSFEKFSFSVLSLFFKRGLNFIDLVPLKVLPYPVSVIYRIPSALIIFLFIPIISFAQTDTTLLTYNQFITNVLNHHPLAKQANLQPDFAAAEMQAARGQFDPQLSSNWNDKYFDKKHYYRIFQAGFRIPTRYGVDFTGGYENTEGVFLNPENKTDKYGLWSAGIEVNVLSGLLMDERRAALQQAEIFQQVATNEQQMMLNELTLSASAAYFYWQNKNATQQVVLTSVALAQTYLNATRLAFFNGDKPAIDTLEAQLIVQDRQLLLQKNAADLAKAQQQLENYLWFENIPLELQPTTIAPPLSTSDLLPNLDDVNVIQLTQNNVEVQEKLIKIAQYEVSQRLKREKLKPKLKLKYNPLLATSEEGIGPSYSITDYKWGFDFSMPLLFRTARAEVEKTELKIRATQLELEAKRNTIQNKMEANLQQQLILQNQLNLVQQNIINYQRLLEAELEKNSIGESSVFLINKRQEKLLDGQVKLLDLQTKIQLTQVEYLFLTNGF